MRHYVRTPARDQSLRRAVAISAANRSRLYTHKFNVNVDDETADFIVQTALREGRSCAAVARDLIEWGREACA